MTEWTVEASVGTVYATVEADDAEAAIQTAIEQWNDEAIDIFAAATFAEPTKHD